MKTINSLYTLIKQKSQELERPLKVVSDLDECLIARAPHAYWKFLEQGEEKLQASFSDFFEDFWKKAEVEFHGYQSTFDMSSLNHDDSNPQETWQAVKKISRENLEIYEKGIFLSYAEDLLRALKEGLIGQLIVAGNKSPWHKNDLNLPGDPRKRRKLQKTFGKFSQFKFHVNDPVELSSSEQKEMEEKGKKTLTRYEWTKRFHSDFDIFVDDNAETAQNVADMFPDKPIVMPNYKCCVEQAKGGNILFIPNLVSDIKDKDFEVESEKNYNLYQLIKHKSQEKDRPLKIVCDWNDVIQDAVSYPLWDIEKKAVTYKEYFQKFWSEYKGDLYWRKDEKLDQLVNAYWKDSEYFNKVPFLSPAKELLLALEENLIEELLFLSSYSERIHPGGDKRKLKRFEATFGQISQVKGLKMIPSSGDTKGEWISKNYPDFDVFIDDSPRKILSVMNTFPDKVYVLPNYKCNDHVQGENVYHVKTEVSDLSAEGFVKSVQELDGNELTSIVKLLKNLSLWGSKSPLSDSIVLIMDGSMNPIHKQHINNFETAKKAIESKNSVKVVAGYISPSCDDYVKRKLGDEAIDASHRIEMARLATEESTLVEIDRQGVQFPTGSVLDKMNYLKNYLNSNQEILKYCNSVKLTYLCGSDLVERDWKSGWKTFSELTENGYDVVIIGREKNNANWKISCENHLDLICGNKKWKEFILFVDGPENNETSSTKARNIIVGKEKGYLTNLLSPKVLEYIQNHELLQQSRLETKIEISPK